MIRSRHGVARTVRRSMTASTMIVSCTISYAMAGDRSAAYGEPLAERNGAITSSARGVVRAIHQAALTTELMAPVHRLTLREGDRFVSGQTLLEFDCRRQRHELASLAAQVQEAKISVVSNQHLLKGGASNFNDVEVARARHDKAQAEFSSMQVRLQACTVVAPFDGVVTEISVNAHELPQAGRPFMTIASDRLLEIEIIIPSRQLSLARIGDAIVFNIDETGGAHNAVVRRTGGNVDAVSQTVKIFAVFVEGSADVLPGMSGSVAFPTSR